MMRSIRFTARTAARAVAATVVLAGALASTSTAGAEPPCPLGAQCGSVTVPLDRGDPAAGTIDIGYALVARTDTSQPALSTIVTNIGGPGQSTIASAGLYTTALAPLRTRRDLLLIDPRGTGRSGALTCPSLAAHDPASLEYADIQNICAGDLGPRARFYGSAAVADDFDAVRSALHIDRVDLWGDSYGTFLMPVVAARHPDHVRSIVLDAANPLAMDLWGRDVLHGVRRVIALVCARSRRCSGAHVLARIATLAQRLRRHPVAFRAHGPRGLVRLTLGEHALAAVTYGGGDPAVYGLLPAATDAALHGDLALLKRLVAAKRLRQVAYAGTDPTLDSFATKTATACHDYPRPFSLTATPSHRRAAYDRALAALDPAQFAPFSAGAWLSTDIEAGPKCLSSAPDPTAGSPVQGYPFPDVPVLVQSGELDTNNPVEHGRAAAAEFAHPTFAIVANAGHTPDLQPCGLAMAIDFVAHLKTDPNRCRHAGKPPTVVGRPAVRAAQLRLPPVRATASVRRAIAVALATSADAQAAATYSGLTGTIDALRGGAYIVGPDRVRFVDARVVTDAKANGTGRIGRRGSRLRLRLRGRGVAPAQLTLRSTQRTTRVTGTIAGHRVALRFAATQ